LDFPAEYTRFLLWSNGGEGELSVEPGWFSLWPAEEVVELNEGYEVQTRLPGFFGFGSSGGGELLAFDTRTTPWNILSIPFIPLYEEEAVLVAANLGEFMRLLGFINPPS